MNWPETQHRKEQSPQCFLLHSGFGSCAEADAKHDRAALLGHGPQDSAARRVPTRNGLHSVQAAGSHRDTDLLGSSLLVLEAGCSDGVSQLEVWFSGTGEVPAEPAP